MSRRKRHSSPFKGPWQFITAIIFFLLGLAASSFKSYDFHVPKFLQDVISETVKPQVTTPAGYENILVIRAIDGDTLELENKEHVRLIGVDTPESRKNEKAIKDSQRTGTDIETIIQLGQKAKNFTKHLVENKRVRLEFDAGPKDKYGRLLAYVYVGDMFVNAAIIKEGYASPMTIPPNVKFADLFRNLYQEARAEKRGLWQGDVLVQR